MQNVNGTTITLTKGDTFQATVSIYNSDGTAYTPVSGDVIKFAMKHYYSDSAALITKTIDNSTMILRLDPEDTENLSAGTYVWDMQLTNSDGDVDTFIASAQFVLTEGVC